MLSYLKWVLLIISIYVQGYYSVKFIQNDPFLMISLIILISISVFMLLALYLIKEEEKILLNDESISKQFISYINKEFSYSNNIPIHNIEFDYKPKNIEAIKFIIGSFFIAGLLGSFFGIGETLGDSISSLSLMKNIDIVKLISPLGNLKTVIGVSISGLLTALTIETFLQDLYLNISKFEAKISRSAKAVASLEFEAVKKEENNKFDFLLKTVDSINTNMKNLSQEIPKSLQDINTTIKTIESITHNFKLYGNHLINKLKTTSDSTLNDLAEKTNFIYESIQYNNKLILEDVKNNNKENLNINNKIFDRFHSIELKNSAQLENINRKSEELFKETNSNFNKMFDNVFEIQKKQYDNIVKLYENQLSKNELSFNKITDNFKIYTSDLIQKFETTSKSILNDLEEKSTLIYKDIQDNNKLIFEDVKNNNKENLNINNQIIEKVSEVEIKNFTQLENINKKSEDLFTETKNNFTEMFILMYNTQEKHSKNIDELYKNQLSKNESSFDSIIKNLSEVSNEIIKTKDAISSNKNISVDINKFILSSNQLISEFKYNIEIYKNDIEKITKNISQSINKTDDTLKTIENVSLVMKNNLKDFQLLESSYKNMFNSDGLN